jgi:uncharacterized membrane protein SpoIIM required for sporulation
MNKQSFLRERRPAWERFHSLLARVETLRRPRLSGDEVTELSELFRALCYDLALVRSRDWGSSLERYLNDLVVRGHGAFYGLKPKRRGQIARFFSAEFPSLLRQNQVFFWVSLTVFAVPLIVSWILVSRDPSLAQRVLPGTALHTMDEMYSTEIESNERQDAAMAGFYVHHNTSIAFQCFALGIFFGVGTLYVLLSNGIQLGTISGYVIAQGHGERFLSFVVSHSSFELTAIVVAGAAGLVLGHSLLAPGALSRLAALRIRGLVAVKLALGSAGMLFIAALIEGFWSAQPTPPFVKYVAALVLWAVVIVYLLLAGRGTNVTRSEA